MAHGHECLLNNECVHGVSAPAIPYTRYGQPIVNHHLLELNSQRAIASELAEMDT